MKVKFKGPVQGQPFGCTVNGKTATSQTWGVAGITGAFPAALSRAAWNARTLAVDVLSEAATAADQIVLTGQPAVGRAVVREDGRITLDLTDYLGTTALTLPYRALKAGAEPVDGTLTVTITDTQISPRQNGTLQAIPRQWGRGRHYVFPVNAYDEYVLERHPTARIWHTSNAGLTRAAIAARETANGNTRTEAQITDAWIAATIAAGTSVRYGETEALALAPAVVESLMSTYCKYSATPHWVLLHRGETFTFTNIYAQGLSRRYPMLVGCYGDRALAWPILSRGAEKALYFNNTSHVVFQNLQVQNAEFTGAAELVNSEFIIFDGLRCLKGSLDIGGSDILKRGITVRRHVALDNYYLSCPSSEPDGALTAWSVPGARTAGLYVDTCDGLLVEKCFADMTGWAPGYAYDSRATAPQPPSNRSHSAYLQYTSLDVSVRDYLSSRPANCAIQHRCGGIVTDAIFLGGNGGINPQGIMADGGSWTTLAGSFSLLYNLFVTMGGQHDAPRSAYGMYRADGIRNQTYLVAAQRAVAAHVGTGNPIAEFGPCGPAKWPDDQGWVPAPDGSGSVYAEDVTVYDWTPGGADKTRPGASAAAMDAATLDGWISAHRGVATVGLDATADYLRTLAEPWALVRPILRDLIPAYGYPAIPLRVAATTVKFQPQADGATPGMRADIEADWSTRDLPGTVAGDSLALMGHRLHWAINPAKSIANLDFGGGELVMWGGTLRPTGSVSGGGRLVLDYVSEFQGAGYAGADLWTVVAQGNGRWVNAGAVTGPVDLTVRNGAEAVLARTGGRFAVASGRTLTVEGGALVTTEGTGALTLAAGSTLRLVTGQVIEVTGRVVATTDKIHSFPISFRLGSTVTGATSGATARVLELRNRGWANGTVTLGDVVGTFVAGEALSGPSIVGWQERAATTIGTVNGTPPARLIPTIAAAGAVTLGGTLDVTGLPVGTHTIITAGSVSGAFGSVLAGAGRTAAVDTTEAGKVKVTVG